MIILRQKSKSLFNILLILFFSLLALKARRNWPFFYTTFFYVTLDVILTPPTAGKGSLTNARNNHLFRQDSSLTLRMTNISQKINEFLIPILISLVAFILITQVPKTVSFDSAWTEYCTKGLSVYPCRAIKKFPQLSGNVYAAYEWGGFLIWQEPNIKVFVDGRMPAWKDENGKSPYQVFLEIIQTQPGWNDKLNRLKTDYLLIGPGTFLDLLLQKESVKYGWNEKYRDDVGVIYKKL